MGWIGGTGEGSQRKGTGADRIEATRSRPRQHASKSFFFEEDQVWRRNETRHFPPPPTDAKAEDLWDGKGQHSQCWDMPNHPKDIHWKHEE